MMSETFSEKWFLDSHEEAALKDRRGRRIDQSCRMFFFGDEEFEGEATLLDIRRTAAAQRHPLN